MSKITFRADDELIERIEERDASKSEIMREALRAYLDREEPSRVSESGRAPNTAREHDRREVADRDIHSTHTHRESVRADTLDAALAKRVDELVAERLAEREVSDHGRRRRQDVNVNVTLESDAPVRATEDSNRRARSSDVSSDERLADQGADTRPPDESTNTHQTDEIACGQCGESLSDDHVYCPNCGEKAARRLFCECGDEVRSDWGFCPSCGRRTPAADVLDHP